MDKNYEYIININDIENEEIAKDRNNDTKIKSLITLITLITASITITLIYLISNKYNEIEEIISHHNRKTLSITVSTHHQTNLHQFFPDHESMTYSVDPAVIYAWLSTEIYNINDEHLSNPSLTDEQLWQQYRPKIMQDITELTESNPFDAYNVNFLKRHSEQISAIVLNKTDHVIMTIMGTASISDMITDVTAGTTDDGVHSGFGKLAEDQLNKLIQLNVIHTNQRITLTGHSLGGAVAELIGIKLLQNQLVSESNFDGIITFGAPPAIYTGGSVFGGDHTNDELLFGKLNIIEVKDRYDPVPSLSLPECIHPFNIKEIWIEHSEGGGLNRITGRYHSMQNYLEWMKNTYIEEFQFVSAE